MGDEQRATSDDPKDPAEQEALARDLGEELTDAFVRYVRGELEFADLTFTTFETLQDVYIVGSGEYEVEYEDEDAEAESEDGDVFEHYDQAAATEQQEDLAQEPARP